MVVSLEPFSCFVESPPTITPRRCGVVVLDAIHVIASRCERFHLTTVYPIVQYSHQYRGFGHLKSRVIEWSTGASSHLASGRLSGVRISNAAFAALVEFGSFGPRTDSETHLLHHLIAWLTQQFCQNLFDFGNWAKGYFLTVRVH